MLVSAIERELKISAGYIEAIISSSDNSYKEYHIQKKNGGTRKIEHPARKLKLLQRWVARKVFSRLPIHPCASAYIKGRNIRENALAHAGHKFLLKLDFQEFFPSLKDGDVDELLRKHIEVISGVLAESDFQKVCRIVCRRGSLVIGAPSSPIVSNTLMYEFDSAVWKFCKEAGVSYTRYADDLTFSTSESDVLSGVHQRVKSIIEGLGSPNLSFNSDKTHHSSTKHRMRVTGLVLTSQGGVSVGRLQKRRIRSMVYRAKQGGITQEELNYLQGYLNFIARIEPHYIESLRLKYDSLFVDGLRK